MVMTRDELVDKIADLFIEYSDDDGQWDGPDICEAVMRLLVAEAPDRLVQCGDCSTWYPHQIYDSCPYYDSHECGDCGNRNDECSCDDCPQCHVYYEDCECPRCTMCSNPAYNCTCPEEERVFA